MKCKYTFLYYLNIDKKAKVALAAIKIVSDKSPETARIY